MPLSLCVFFVDLGTSSLQSYTSGTATRPGRIAPRITKEKLGEGLGWSDVVFQCVLNNNSDMWWNADKISHGRQLRPLPASLRFQWQSMVAFPPHFIAAAIFLWGPVYCLCLDIKILYNCTCTICTHRRTQKFSKSVQSADGRWRSQWDLEMEKINRIYVYYLGLGRKSFLLYSSIIISK